MGEIIHFYGPVQGMVRIDDYRPSREEMDGLTRLIRETGCRACGRFAGDCGGVKWIGLESSYLYRSQGVPVYTGADRVCKLAGTAMAVPGHLVVKK